MALIQQDLIPGSGDQLLTLDTDTSLQWLNLTVTANRSYTEIQAGFGNFIGTYGFQYANAGQVSTLLQHAGITRGVLSATPNDLLNHNGIQTIQALMNGRVLLATGGSAGWVVTNGIYQPRLPVPVPPAPLDGYTTWLSLTDPANSRVDSGPLVPATTIASASPEIASYLVRPALTRSAQPLGRKRRPRKKAGTGTGS